MPFLTFEMPILTFKIIFLKKKVESETGSGTFWKSDPDQKLSEIRIRMRIRNKKFRIHNTEFDNTGTTALHKMINALP
jgi:hypothetical protein